MENIHYSPLLWHLNLLTYSSPIYKLLSNNIHYCVKLQDEKLGAMFTPPLLHNLILNNMCSMDFKWDHQHILYKIMVDKEGVEKENIQNICVPYICPISLFFFKSQSYSLYLGFFFCDSHYTATYDLCLSTGQKHNRLMSSLDKSNTNFISQGSDCVASCLVKAASVFH
jgi:hypothetical protein